MTLKKTTSRSKKKVNLSPRITSITNLTTNDEFVLNKDEVLALLKELKYSYIDYDNELAVKVVRNMIRWSEQ